MLAHILSTIGGPRVSLSASYNVGDTSISPINASATFSLENDGDVTKTTGGGGTTDLGDWISPAAAAGANYECYATLNSGTLTSGTTGSWLALNLTRSWNLQRTTVGPSSVSLTIQIRNAASLVVLASTDVTITAEKS